MATTWNEAKSMNESVQDRNKTYADKNRRNAPSFKVGDLVWVDTHTHSNATKGITTKFHPKRDGPYRISKIISPVSYQVSDPSDTRTWLGTYHMSALTIANTEDEETPVVPLRRRGRPRKFTGPSSRRV